MTTGAPNVEMREYWNSPIAHHWVDDAQRYDRMLGVFGDDVLEAVAPAAGERVLDIGCGTGPLAVAAAHRVAPADVLGVDISEQMLAAARERAIGEDVANISFVAADAQVHPFPSDHFDVVVSRFGVMFFEDPTAAFANVRRAMRPGARLGFVAWQSVFANPWVSVPVGAVLEHVELPDAFGEGPGPFSFADDDFVRSILAGAGFSEIEIRGSVRPMTLGGGGTLDETHEFVARSGMVERLLIDAAPEVTERAVAAIRGVLEANLTGEGVVFDAATWIVTATA